VKIHKAVITAAGPGQASLPLQYLVDRDGETKSVLQIIVQEALHAVDEVCLVVRPGDQDQFAQAAGPAAAAITFVQQDRPRGYGHALLCARDFTGDEAFLHFVSDHLYIAHHGSCLARHLVETAEREQAAVSAVQATRETQLPYYGAVGGTKVPHVDGLYQVERVLEKPTPTDAEQELVVPGLRAGHYLCFFGMHVLTPTVMKLLERQLEASDTGTPVELSHALDELARSERYLAIEAPGTRYNVGVKYGLFTAQLALALAGKDRDDVLAQTLEVLANRESLSP
jgi:UTP--glucose-1-phosphate uridylyltransferase